MDWNFNMAENKKIESDIKEKLSTMRNLNKIMKDLAEIKFIS